MESPESHSSRGWHPRRTRTQGRDLSARDHAQRRSHFRLSSFPAARARLDDARPGCSMASSSFRATYFESRRPRAAPCVDAVLRALVRLGSERSDSCSVVTTPRSVATSVFLWLRLARPHRASSTRRGAPLRGRFGSHARLREVTRSRSGRAPTQADLRERKRP